MNMNIWLTTQNIELSDYINFPNSKIKWFSKYEIMEWKELVDSQKYLHYYADIIENQRVEL